MLLRIEIEALGAAIGQGTENRNVDELYTERFARHGIHRSHQPRVWNRQAEVIGLGPRMISAGWHMEFDVLWFDHRGSLLNKK